MMLAVFVLLGITSSCPPPTAENAPPKQAASEERTRADIFGDPLPPGAITRLGCTRLGHGGNVRQIAFSPDGKILASASLDGLIRFWDVQTGKEVRQLRGHKNNSWIYAFVFSPNGKLLASCGQLEIKDPKILALDIVAVWDAETGKRRCVLQHWSKQSGLQPANSAAFSPDGKILASGCGVGLHLWDLKTQNVLQFLPCPKGTDVIAFSRDGATIFSASQNEAMIRRWNVSTGKELPPLNGQKKIAWNTALAINADERSLAACGKDKICRIWDLSSGKVRLQLGDEKTPVCCPLFSPDGKTIAGIVGNQVRFWDAPTGKELRRMTTETNAEGLAFSPDGSTLAWHNRSTVYLADAKTGKSRFKHTGHKGVVATIAFSPDGTQVLTSGGDETTRVWEWQTSRELNRKRGYARALSPDGKIAASATEGDKEIRLWEIATGNDLHRFPVESANVPGYFPMCAFSPDGRYFVSNEGKDHPIRVWETATGKKHRQIPVDGLVSDLMLSTDAQYIAAMNSGRRNAGKREHRLTASIWELQSGKKIPCPPELGGYGLAFVPESTVLACGRAPLRLWDVRTREYRGRIEVPEQMGGGLLAVSPDGKSLATSGGGDSSVYLWEIATGQIRTRLEGHTGYVGAAAFSPDGKLLVTGGTDGLALVWDVMDVDPSRKDQKAKLTAEALADCWSTLGLEDAEKAWRAMRALVAGSEQTVALLSKRLSVQSVPAEKVVRWIAELDDNAFAVRERASRELAALGKTAIPALRRAQTNSPSAEVTRRVNNLLAKVDKPGLSALELTTLRAVEVLEHVGTSQARQLLAKLAKGAADARQTQEARASLRRLEKRANKP